MEKFPITDYEILQRKCDYSFGDQSGVICHCPNAYMKKANIDNQEFLDKCEEIRGEKKEYMTLYADNIRLYKRPIEYSDWLHLKPISPSDRGWLNTMLDEDLLHLCSQIPDIKFIIFTAHEDTPLDEHIFNPGVIPENVLAIHSAGSVFFGGKVFPLLHGLQRQMNLEYDRHEIMQKFILDNREANKLLYVNCRADTGNRGGIHPMFSSKGWPTMGPYSDYEIYLNGIKDHKFTLCPSGNGIDTHRGCEVLYMKRVPVLEKHPFLESVYSDFPALFVNDFSEVTEDLLIENNSLYEEAKNINFDKLNLDKMFYEKTEVFYQEMKRGENNEKI